MVEITKEKNAFDYYALKIQTNEGIFEISFQNNLDLYWRYIHKDCILSLPNEKEFYITKENYFLYSLFQELFNNIKANNPKKLFKNNRIDWYSDDFCYENASRLLIEKFDEYFKVTFIKSKKEYDDGIFMTYSVRISNSGSRYNPYNIVFMNMYNNLKEYEPNYHQVHIEEVIYQQKLLKRKVK